jgi:hypothetical protein
MALEMLLPTLLITAAWYLAISTCTYRLAALGGHPNPRRAFLPIENIGMLYEIAGKDRSKSRWAIVFMLGIPVVGSLMFSMLGGALMQQTGRSPLTGYLLALPPVALLGLPLIAYSARSVRQPIPVRA